MGRARAVARWWFGLLLAALVVGGLAVPGHAHWADLAVAEITVYETRTEIVLVFPTGLLRTADDDHDGHLAGREIIAHRAGLEAVLAERIRVTGGGEAAVLSIEPVASPATRRNLNLTSGTHSTLKLTYAWLRPVRRVSIRYGLFEPGISTASCLATIAQAGRVRSFVFTPEHQEVIVSAGRASVWPQVSSFLALGIEHILTGYDHILFLLTLLMLGGGMRYLVKVTSAFTIAHSITLSLAALQVVALPARWVESAIALSIVYVALENFWRKEVALRDRWLVTFGFGLVHGLGFASILREVAIPRGELAISLAGFNLGVEAGQITVVLAAFAVLQTLRRWPREGIVRRLISAAAAAAGLVWFIQRAFLS